VSFAAAKALWTLDDPEGRDALIAVLGRESKTSSNFITAQMRQTLRLLHMPKDLFMFAFKNGVGFAPVPGIGAGVSSLQAILSDSSVSGRAAAALLMANDPAPEVLVALHDALGDKDATVRAAAVHALAMRGDTGTIETVRGLMDDMKEPVRFRAAAAYLRLAWLVQSRIYNGKSAPKAGAKTTPAKTAPKK
jgi:HEAT repeat protein